METVDQDLKEIRRLMEHSTRFISLSGLAGILAGVYALIGAWVTQEYFLPRSQTGNIVITGSLVLLAALTTAALLSKRRATRQGERILSKPVRQMLLSLATPLLTGGVFSLILLQKNYYELLAASMIIFYGLALINASKYTASYVRTLGYLQLLLGLTAAVFSEWGLLLWSISFGWLHIVYSSYVYWKYER